MRKHFSWIWVLPAMFVRHPDSIGPGLAYIGWKTARFALLLAMLPLALVRLFIFAIALTALALTGAGRILYAAMEYANAPRRFLTRKMCESAGDIRAIRRREGLPMRN